jgi:hypothetical protein
LALDRGTNLSQRFCVFVVQSREMKEALLKPQAFVSEAVMDYLAGEADKPL